MLCLNCGCSVMNKHILFASFQPAFTYSILKIFGSLKIDVVFIIHS